MSSPRTAAKRVRPPQRSTRNATPPLEGERDGADAALSEAAAKLAAKVEQELARGRTDVLAPEALQALMAAACKAYSMQIEAGGAFPPLSARTTVNATDVMVTTSALLKSVNLQLFELGMWQSWTGR